MPTASALTEDVTDGFVCAVGGKAKASAAGGAGALSGKHKPIDWQERMQMPTIRGGLNGSISDILEASGYGTATAFKVDEEAT